MPSQNAMAALLLCLCATAAVAAPPAPDSKGRLYRYYDEYNRPTVTDTITPEHTLRGYDELTPSLQVLRHVPGQRPLTPEELAAAKAKREAAAQRKRDDEHLLRLYASPADAEFARNRQIDAIQVRIDFSNSALAGLRQRRAAEAQKAAAFERTGRPVPGDLKESIASYDRQIQASLASISARKTEQEKTREEFAAIIERLHVLTGKPAPEKANATP